jgi:NADPH:quinone reductase-like Zn-dependent oxidoreductase
MLTSYPSQAGIGRRTVYCYNSRGHNHAYVKNLGATYVFNHKDPNVVEEISKVLKTGDVVFDAISTEGSQKLPQRS